MVNTPQISDAEWQVMNVLWEESPLTASDVADRVCEAMNWSPRTVKTLLGRLVRKGALKYREEGKHYLYEPRFPREKFVKQASRDFLDRVFGGDASPALVHFVKQAKLSKAEIEELRQILDERLD